MKKVKTITLLLVLLALIIPASSVFARKNIYLLTIRNRTGGDMVLDLMQNTKHNNATYLPGMAQIEVKEGIYNFYLSTPCGNTAGQVNLNFRKTLFVTCRGGAPYVQLDRQFISWGYKWHMTRFTGE